MGGFFLDTPFVVKVIGDERSDVMYNLASHPPIHVRTKF